MLKKLLLPIIFICAHFSQAQQHICGTDELHHQKMIEDPLYRINMEKFEEFVQSEEFRQMQAQARTVGATTVYTIPVVFHVMHKGEAVGTGINISDQAIYNSIKSLNSRFRKQGGGIGDGNGVDVGIEFALAVRDPNGNCTNGINRINMSGDATYMQYGIQRSGANGITDTYLKTLSYWDAYRYYNIWVISEIDDNNGGGGIQGYAYFASAHGANYDGAVMLTNCITDTARVTLPHELGHAFNLYHTFEGDGTGATCPANATCATQGDMVCDTPPHMRSPSNCNPGGTNACDGGSSNALFVHNYMDYASDDCQNEFTAGQRTRVQAALTTRASLLEENGNMSLVPPTTADVNFFASKTLVCTGQKVQLFDNSKCVSNIFISSLGWNNISFNWTVTNNAGTTLNSTVQNPVFTMSVAGTYDVTLSITNAFGTTNFTKKGLIVVTASPIAATCTGGNTTMGTNFGYGIFEVHLNTLHHYSSGTIDDVTLGYTNATGYGDFSCSASTVLAPNTTYTFTLKGSTPANGEDFKVYIDYNNDGDFVDGGETILSFDNITGSSSYLTQNFTTPASPIMNTSLRMRVFSARSDETITPCYTTIRGQVHDYAVIFSANVASVTIAAAPGTTVTYGTNVTFTATPVNGGAGPTYQWYLNGVLQAGFTGNTFNSSTLLHGDQVYCILTSNLAGVIGSPVNSNTITMTINGTPISNFTQNKTVLCTGSTVTYTDQSNQVPTSWAWTFAGGTPGTSTTQNPTITYSVAGTYNTTLTASNGFGTGTTNTKTNLITVSTAPTAVCASFTRTNANTGTSIGVHRVTLNTIDNITDYQDAVFVDYSCSRFTTLQRNVTYNIEIKVGNSNTQRVRVYIDYNGNNDFTDIGETVFAPANGLGVRSGSFTVPATADNTKLLRMRVISDFNVTPTPCGTAGAINYGQVEDYGIMIDASALPISLTSLKADRVNAALVRVDWTLAQFSDVQKFVIEKSLDGQIYTEAESITPNNSFNNSTVSYQIQDNNDYIYTSYYRLKTVYLDGTQEYSNSVPVKGALNSFTTQVAPVPVSGNELTVYSSAAFEEGQWEIYSASGALQAKGKLETGNASMNIPIAALINGHYFVKITGVTQSSVNRFCVLR